MKAIQILRIRDKACVTTSLEAIVEQCDGEVNEFDMRVLKEMNRSNEIAIIPVQKNH